MRKTSKTIYTSQNFYSDILARSLLRIKVPKYEAYRFAHSMWLEVVRKKGKAINLTKRVEYFLRKKYPALLPKYRVWRKNMKKTKPLVLLICGGTGIGTSTLAMRLAWLLEVHQIVSTDAVREVIRHFIQKNVLPILHVSTYQTGKLIEEVKSSRDRVIYGFLTQSREVLNGIEAVIKRAITEKTSIVIEGVHLVPGEMDFLKKYERNATIITIMLDVNQASKHRLHFFARYLHNKDRKKTKYLKNFKEIRLIRDYLVEQSYKHGVPVIQNYDLRKAEQEVLEKIYSKYARKK